MTSSNSGTGDPRTVDYKQMNIPEDLSSNERERYDENQTVQLKDKETGKIVEVTRTDESPELGKLLMVCGIIGAVLLILFLVFSLAT
ncbi:hypothetical protein [Desulfonatronospira sp.]|uniref:hypothetical protein n=1 Tax=Desulfonatronospira sp. TaxID=1962951 RepID=UPI0025C1ABEB|nr:hypothetical protein [Desulfonatronospira sp.]